MFRHIAADRRQGEIRELAGVTIASAGSSFQMFNAAFFNSMVVDQGDLERRIALAQVLFSARGMDWSLWVCEELLTDALRKRLARSCEQAGLHMSAEMPAMVTEQLLGTMGECCELEIRPVRTMASLREFCQIGASCFRVPLKWFHEIFDDAGRFASKAMAGWVGYYKGKAVCTVATVSSDEVIGVYNLATSMPFRERGFGEAMLRYAVRETFLAAGEKPLVLQSTQLGLRLYERLGFRKVGRILVFPSR